MIPKVIHYCWFGNNPLPEKYLSYIETWRKFCPDYEIKEWNEKNFDVTSNDYCREAYAAGKWAFVSDYARLKIIYDNGGIYLDTDVEMIKDIRKLVKDGDGFIGFQNNEQITTGLGFSAEKGNECIKTMLDMYVNCHFKSENGKLNMLPCPARNTVALKKCGLKTGKKNMNNVQYLNGITVYPVDYFNPINFDTKKSNITNNTYCIHHYSSSWTSSKTNLIRKLKVICPDFLLNWRSNKISRKDIKMLEEGI